MARAARDRSLGGGMPVGSRSERIVGPVAPSEDEEERADALALTMRAKPSGWNVQDELNEIRGLIDKALSGMGWPNSKQRIAVNADGKWRPIEAREDVRENEKFWWSFLWIREAAPPLSEVFYLGNMVFSLECLQKPDLDQKQFIKNIRFALECWQKANLDQK